VYLDEGVYYPMRVVYGNLLTDAALKFEIVQPNGIIDDFSNVVNFPTSDYEACVTLTYGETLSISTAYSFTDGPVATSYAEIQKNGGATDYIVEQFYVPTPTITISETTIGKTSTEYVTVSLTTGASGVEAVYVDVVVQTATTTGTATATATTTSTPNEEKLTGNFSGTGCNFNPTKFFPIPAHTTAQPTNLLGKFVAVLRFTRPLLTRVFLLDRIQYKIACCMNYKRIPVRVEIIPT